MFAYKNEIMHGDPIITQIERRRRRRAAKWRWGGLWFWLCCAVWCVWQMAGFMGWILRCYLKEEFLRQGRRTGLPTGGHLRGLRRIQECPDSGSKCSRRGRFLRQAPPPRLLPRDRLILFRLAGRLMMEFHRQSMPPIPNIWSICRYIIKRWNHLIIQLIYFFKAFRFRAFKAYMVVVGFLPFHHQNIFT